MCRVYTNSEKQAMQNVRKSQPHVCFYCHQPLSEREITIDHVVPYARGGQTTEDNLVIACEECNQEKSDMTLQEYAGYLKIKQEAIKSVDLELESIKLSDLYEQQKEITRDYNIAKHEYTTFIDSISLKPIEEEKAHFKLQKLQLLMWEYNSNKSKKERIDEVIGIQQQVVDLLDRKRKITVDNATEDFKQMLGKLKVDVVKRKFDENLNISYEFKNEYPDDTESVIDISFIHIKDAFKSTPPASKKMKYIEQYYDMFRKLDKAIVLNQDNVLVNGYTRYLLMKHYRSELVPVRYVSESHNNNVTTNIIGNNNQVNISL